MNLSGHPVHLGQNMFVSSATQQHPLGTKGIDQTGRVFRYCQAGASDLVAGNAIQSSAIVANHLAMTPSAAAIGAVTVSVTPGATAGAANLYAEGYLGTDTTPGNGIVYAVKSHPAIVSSTAFSVTLYDEDAITVAITTASRLDLIANPYKNVIQFPVTTATGSLVGVASYIITATQYGWIQTHGLATPLIAGTPALGAGIMSPGTTAGASVVVTTTNLVVAQYVGRMAQIGVDGKNNFAWLSIGE